MDQIELETIIDLNGNVHLPAEYQELYGKRAKISVTLDEPENTTSLLRSPGSAKGKLVICSEDGEHLNDFKDYLS